MISLGHLMKDSVKLGKMDIKLGQVVSNPYARAFAPQIKEGEDDGAQQHQKDGGDHEVHMAHNQLDTIIKAAVELRKKLGDGEKDIPAWIQDHISNAENYITQASSGYYEYKDESIVNEDNTSFETLMLIRNLEQTNKLLAQDLKTSKRLPNDKKENIKKSIVVNQGLINYYKENFKNLKNNESVNEASPCWKGYKQVGMKNKGGKQVPNCVPEGVVKEDWADGDDTKNGKKPEEKIKEAYNFMGGVPKMYVAYLGLQKKVRELEDKQKELLQPYLAAKKSNNVTAINRAVDVLKKNQKTLEMYRKNLDNVERQYITSLDKDTEYEG